MKRYYFSIIIGLLLIGLLAACGGSGETEDTSSEPEVVEEDGTEEETDEAEETEEPGGSAVTTIEEGKLTFGLSGLYRPFNFEDLDGNETGFEVELGEAIAEEMGLEPNPVFTQDFGALIEEVNSDRIDVIMGSLDRN